MKNAVIYIVAALAGLFLSWVGLVFAMTGGKQFALVIGGLLVTAHIGTFAYVGYKARQGKGRQAAVVLILPLFIVMGIVFVYEAVRLQVLHTSPDKVIKWQEEVALSTGEVLIVDRELLYRPASSDAPGRTLQEMTIRFRNPSGAKETTEWRTVRYDKRSTPVPGKVYQRDLGPGKGGPNMKVSYPERPLVLDVESETKSIFLITIAAGKSGCNEYYRYRYENGMWQDDMLPETFEPRHFNLFLDFEQDSVPNYVDRATVRLSGESKIKRYREIGPDRCLCGRIDSPFKGGCMQSYKSAKE